MIMLWRGTVIVLLASILAVCVLWFRDVRDYRAGVPPSPGIDQVRLTTLYAGGQPLQPTSSDFPRAMSGFDVSEGKRLYQWFNCNGCHANGGGDIGPALMDDKWIYGAEPRNIYRTIVEGRPNGMPSFGGKIPDAQVWQLVAYVRSMSGLVSATAAPGRNDDIQSKPPETLTPPQPPQEGGSRPRDQRTTQ
jgi:cytochrome c oxidase cbb3-type subunit 3